MIWLLLATWAAAVAALVWFLSGDGPWILGPSVALAWLVGRAVVALVARRRADAAPPGATVRARVDTGDERDPDAVAAAALGEVEAALPGTALELWLLDDRNQWRVGVRAGSRGVEAPPPPADLRQWLAGLHVPVAREALAAVGGSAAELAASGLGRLALPLTYAGRLLGLVWASGPDGLESHLSGVRRQIEDALGHARLLRHVAQQTEVAAEVELAVAVQQAFIPGRAAHRFNQLDLAGSTLSASQCGGDFWTCHDLGGGRTLVMVADVTGHGIGAARITAAARGAHDVAVHVREPPFSLARLFDALDAAVRRVGSGHYHMTCFAAVIDARRRALYAGAGHVSPYVCRRDANGAMAIDSMLGRGNPLGMGPPRQAPLDIAERQLAAGDLVLFYSDGLTDCAGPGNERLGERRLQRLLRQLAAEPLDVEPIRDRIEQFVLDFSGGAPLPDDITFVVVRIR